jgi:hypothetical protein
LRRCYELSKIEPEQAEVLYLFTKMLEGPTLDGKDKREKGEKPSWKVDSGHEGSFFSHVARWKKGELVDPDSGVHPLIHAAWRALAIAWQETNTPPDLENLDLKPGEVIRIPADALLTYSPPGYELH